MLPAECIISGVLYVVLTVYEFLTLALEFGRRKYKLHVLDSG